jgi:2-amino-4-hydroxy-6-hydroxymethyldihydropteridine diphosphokinase
MADVFLSLGSNIGFSANHIGEAVRRLQEDPELSVIAVSRLYRTKPVGPVEQNDFVNAAARLETDLSPSDLMKKCLALEAAMGRDRVSAVRWGPRVIDIDIILYDDLTMKNAEVEIPHPRFLERAFVLVPMAEIAPERTVRGHYLRELAASIDSTGVELLPP